MKNEPDAKQSETESAGRYLGLNLVAGVRSRHMSVFYLACFAAIMLAVFVPSMLPYLLTEFLSVPEGEHGVFSGSLTFWGEAMFICAVLLWGPLSDRVGRRLIMAAAFVLAALSLLIFPRADSYWGLLAARLVFAIGLAAYSCMTTALIADYVRGDSRGKATGLHSLMNGLGALVAVLLLLRLPAILQDLGLDSLAAGISTYAIAAAFAFLVGLSMWRGLLADAGRGRKAPGLGAGDRDPARTGREAPLGFATLLRKGFAAGRHPAIALAYGAAFISRGNIAIVGTFMSLWLTNHGSFELGMDRADAMARGAIILGVTNLAVLPAALAFGYLSDRINYITALMIALAFAALGYGGTWLIADPFGGAMLLCAALIGIGEAACIVTSATLIAQEAPEEARGSVMGFFNLCGGLGIMLAGALGGLLFDAWREAAPFILFGGLAALMLLWAAMVRSRLARPPA